MKDLKVKVVGGQLVVHGTRTEESNSIVTTSSFSRSFDIKNADLYNATSALSHDSVLTITIPKTVSKQLS